MDSNFGALGQNQDNGKAPKVKKSRNLLLYNLLSDMSNPSHTERAIPGPPDNTANNNLKVFDPFCTSEDMNASARSHVSQTTTFSNILNDQFKNEFKVHHLIQRVKKNELMKAIYDHKVKLDLQQRSGMVPKLRIPEENKQDSGCKNGNKDLFSFDKLRPADRQQNAALLAKKIATPKW